MYIREKNIYLNLFMYSKMNGLYLCKKQSININTKFETVSFAEVCLHKKDMIIYICLVFACLYICKPFSIRDVLI